ncbi:MAG: lactonase family protein [Planctomycetales bacterium]
MKFSCHAILLACLLGILMTSAPAKTIAADQPVVFISAFAAGNEGAIHAFGWDLKSGELKPLVRTTGVEHPFFLALSRDKRFLYSIHAKEFGGKNPEEIASFALEGRTGRLKFLNRQSARGTAACYLDLDAAGKSVLVANYSSGSVASLPVQGDGSLGEAASFIQHVGSSVDPARQKEPHAHCIVVTPDGRFALSADLGLDQVLVYRLDASRATLTPHKQPFVHTPPGAGPRHLTVDPQGKHVYVINELANSVTMFDYEAQAGLLIEQQTISTVPGDMAGKSYCADLKITPNGKYLFGTNRGHDSVACYRIAEDGRLTLIEITPSLGKGPQNLALSPDGAWLLCANMPGNNVATFRIDPQSGKLSPIGEPVAITSPSCIMVMP